jgi:hypothetical protein
MNSTERLCIHFEAERMLIDDASDACPTLLSDPMWASVLKLAVELKLTKSMTETRFGNFAKARIDNPDPRL